MRNIFKRLLVLTFAAGIVASIGGLTSCGSAQSEKIKIVAETKGSPKPYIYQTESGELKGYDVAVVKEIFSRLPKYDLQIVLSSSALTDAQTGTVDFTFNNWTYNDERAESFYFSYPITRAKYVINSVKGTSYETFADIAAAGKKVYGSVGHNITNAIELYNQKNPNNAITIDYTNADTTAKLQDYISGEYVEIASIATLTASREAYPEQYSKLEYHIIPDDFVLNNISKSTTSHLLFGKSEKSDKLRKEVSEVILQLYKDGTLKKLADEWVGVDVVPLASDYDEYLN